MRSLSAHAIAAGIEVQAATKAVVVYKLDTAGDCTALYSFAGAGAGEIVYAGLIWSSGFLYGTTFYGGKNGDGAVFRLKP